MVGAGGALTLLDGALRSGRTVHHAPGALRPDGSPVHLTRREGALGLDRGDATTWRALPTVDEALEVSLHPDLPTSEFGFFAHTRLADDGGISLALGRDERLLGVLDPDSLAVRAPLRVRLRAALGCERAHFPGAAGLGLRVASLHARGGAKAFAQVSLWSDGGDLGPLAHCVQGAALDWAKCSELPAGQGLLSTGGTVTAARAADVRELLAALDALDAHALPLRASAQHWATMHRTPGTRAFDDAAGVLFARVLVDPALRPGTQGACARAAQATPFDVARWRQHRAACAQTPEGMALAQLSRAVMERHTTPSALPPEDRLVR